jgi:acyl carrier protein
MATKMTESENTLSTVRSILIRALQLGAKSADLQRETALLGNLPEIDSMAVVHVLAAIEDHFGVVIADDEVSADTFATLGTLADFVEAKLLPRAD